MTDAIQDAIEMLQGRLSEIDEELERYDDLRSERKSIEKTLRAMQPKVKGADVDDEVSLIDQVLEVVASDPIGRWTAALVIAELELGDGDKQRVSTALSTLCKMEKIKRSDRGQYQLA